MKKTESESVVSYISLTDCNYIFYQKSHRAKVVMSIGIFITLVLNLMILYTSKSLSNSQCQNVSDKGIDAIVRHVNQNKKIKKIIVCGKEVSGHKAGHSLFQLYQNGIDNNGRIIGSTSPDPFLTVAESQVKYFQNEISLVNMINETDFNKIKQKIN